MKVNVDDSKVDVYMAPSLLRAALILMSSSPGDKKEETSTIDSIASTSLIEYEKELMMLIEDFVPLDRSESIHGAVGVASAEKIGNGERAASVDEVSQKELILYPRCEF